MVDKSKSPDEMTTGERTELEREVYEVLNPKPEETDGDVFRDRATKELGTFSTEQLSFVLDLLRCNTEILLGYLIEMRGMPVRTVVVAPVSTNPSAVRN